MNLKIKLILAALLAASQISLAQPPPPVTCTISGQNPVTLGDTWTYTISGGSCTATSWTTTCGTVQSSNSSSCTIYFNQTGCSSATITALNGMSTLATKSVTVNAPPALYCYSISNPTQSIGYSATPAQINAPASTGGNCGTSYSYEWFSSTNGITFTFTGGTGQNYQPGALSQTTYYYRVTSCQFQTCQTSDTATVTVGPPLNPGTIIPAALTIASGTSPGSLDGDPASGGEYPGGTYYYQWQDSSSSTSGAWVSISGAINRYYTPGTLTANIWYRRKVVNGSDSAYTNDCMITIGTASTNFSFVRVRTILKPGVTDTVTADGLTSPYDVAQTTTYLDGIGRPMQTVAKEASPLQNDMVSSVVYDNFGRQAIQYMPYTATTNDGNYKSTALVDQATFNAAMFPSEQYYYGQTVYETSPLNRPLLTLAPGMSWIGAGTGISAAYMINTGADSVQIWSISSTQLSLPANHGAYPAGELYKSITTDEEGHQLVEYKDLLGKTILKKVQQSASPSTGHLGWLCTYYVYDTLQNLRMIIQPQAVALINGSWSVSTGIANELCFRYEYDGRRRLAIKKTPGAGQVWLVNDAKDRVAMIQDSLMRAQKKWFVIYYDTLSRVQYNGFITDSTNYNNLAYHDSLAYYSTLYPSGGSYPWELLRQNYYDDYSWMNIYVTPLPDSMATNYTSNSNYFITTYNTSPTYAVPIKQFHITRGMPTGSTIKVVGTSSTYEYNVVFYDDHGRTIQVQDYNYSGGIDTTTMQYNFDGALLRTLINHQKNGHTAQNHIVSTKMDYDQAFRLRHIYKNIDNAATDQLIDSLQYNELGQLVAKYLGNQVDSVIYSYNVRGWLTGINKNYVAGTANHYFGMELGYDKTTSVAPGNSYLNPEYNGNIEGMVWKSAGSGINRKYDFTYDPANRLTSAAFLQNTTGTSWDKTQIDYSVSGLSYDANGNILTMTQRGFTVGGSAPIDSLAYSYLNTDNSNKLMGVTDAANNDSTLLEDFHYNPGTKQSTDYNYDGNGNQTHDNNKNIDTIQYNYLNLPTLVHIKGEGNVAYTYDVTGAKITKVTTDSVAKHSTTTLYLGVFVYQQTDTITNPDGGTDTLQFVGHEEGRIRWAYHKYTTGTTAYKFEYDFFEKDHLGNTRMVLTQQRDTTNYLASMEAAYRSTEVQLFGDITNTSYQRSLVSGYPDDLTYTNPNDSVARVDSNSASGQKVGPNLLLKVMSGDTVKLGVQCYYNSGSGSTNNSSFSDVLNSLANGLVNSTGGAHGTLSNLTSSSSTVYTGLTSFLSSYDSVHSGYPKAYINWIFLDDQFNYVSSLSGSVQAASSTYPSGTLNTVAPGSQLALNRNGYLYIWVSNETQGWDVFFDNLAVQYKQGPVLEENHYYPFGLTMAGISDKAIKVNYAENKYRYNEGTELQNKEFRDGTGLEMYDAGFRRLDPQLGRFDQIDPLADQFHNLTTYQYAGNDPEYYNDPTGLDYNSSSSRSASLQCQSPFGCDLQGPSGSAGPGGSSASMSCPSCGFNDGSGFDWTMSQLPNGDGTYGNLPPATVGSGGTLIYQAGASGDLGNLATAYVALHNLMGVPISVTDTYFAQLLYSMTYAGQISNVTATLTPVGMTIEGTSVESGAAVSLNYSFADVADHINSYISSLDGVGVQGSNANIQSGGGENWDNVGDAVSLTADVQSTAWGSAKIAMKSAGKIIKPFTGPATAVGAVVSGGAALYDMIKNPNANYLEDGVKLGLGAVALFAEFVGIGEVWDWIGVGAAVISTSIDIYDLEHEKKP